MSPVYIAHSVQDYDALLQVHEALRAAGITAWYAPDDASNRDEINTVIDGAFAMIVLVSAEAIRSKSVRLDIERAKARRLKIIPYQIDRARLTGVFKTDVQPLLRYSSAQADGLASLVRDVQAAHKQRCPVIAVMNMKGGVGKTTVTSQLFGTWQAAIGGRILLIDLDPQYNLTQTFLDMRSADLRAAEDRSVISLFERSRLHARDAQSPAEAWGQLAIDPVPPLPREALVYPIMGKGSPGGRLDLVSGQFEIAKYAFAADMDRLNAIKRNFLRSLEHFRSFYDLIVIDTNPNATFLTRCVAEGADYVLAPMQADVYSLRGVKLLNQVLSDLAPDARPRLSVLFNAVGRSEQSTFEADARNGVHDGLAGFALSGHLLKAALPKSAHLHVSALDEDGLAWKQLVVHSGRGGGLKVIREHLKAICLELQKVLS